MSVLVANTTPDDRPKECRAYTTTRACVAGLATLGKTRPKSTGHPVTKMYTIALVPIPQSGDGQVPERASSLPNPTLAESGTLRSEQFDPLHPVRPLPRTGKAVEERHVLFLRQLHRSEIQSYIEASRSQPAATMYKLGMEDSGVGARRPLVHHTEQETPSSNQGKGLTGL
jgi:hypothetical protein